MKQKKVATVMKPSKQVTEAPITEEERVRWTRRLKWEWAEASIWTDAMLTALDNGVKGGKWFSLIDKVHRPSVLMNAWKKVKANKGTAGVDRTSIKMFEANQDKYLAELEYELRTGTYQPKAVRRVYIPKDKGKFRPLGIPTVKDRIAQQAVKATIEPIFENEFLDTSYGFRPKRGAKEAIAEVSKLIEEGYIWVVDADLQAYFDTIPHDKLLNKISIHISDGRIIQLIEKWLEQPIMEECRNWIPTEGTPQGGVISPLLANIYLHDLDKTLEAAKYKMIRYADDFVILTKKKEEAEEALKVVQEWTIAHGLTLHPEKTKLGNCMVEGEGFDFLGYRFEGGTRWVRRKSIQRFRDRIKEKTSRICGQAIEYVIKEINPVLRGWYNYFKEVTKYTLGTFDSFVRRRLRAIVARQNKKRSFGAGWNNVRIPNKYFADRGLFNMEENQKLYIAGQSR
jgi:RNA-directed DNA polymerase